MSADYGTCTAECTPQCGSLLGPENGPDCEKYVHLKVSGGGSNLLLTFESTEE